MFSSVAETVSTPLLATTTQRTQSIYRPASSAAIAIPDDHRHVIPAATSSTPTPPGTTAQGVHQLRVTHRIRRILTCIHPWKGAICLAALSILESLVVARVGTVVGSFYHIVVDRHPAALAGMLAHAAVLYAACVALSAAGTWIAGYFSVEWRRCLAGLLHRRVCADVAYARVPPAVDNIDQRVTTEVAMLCEVFASAMRLAAGAPFRVVYYAWLAAGFVSWKGVAAATGFFIASAAWQRLAAVPLAQATFVQGRREGDLRFAAMRLREHAADVAAYRGGLAEQEHVDDALLRALKNQKKVVMWRAAVTGATKCVDYGGALLNYVMVAAAVFAVAPSTSSGGDVAAFVSNASFYTLALIYSYTELLDLAEKVSEFVAHSARVGELMEWLLPLQRAETDHGEGGDGQVLCHRSWYAETHGRSSSSLPLGSGENKPATSPSQHSTVERELRPSRLAALLQPPTRLYFPVIKGGMNMEISLHALSEDLRKEVEAVFVDAPLPALGTTKEAPPPPLLCCLTFQFAENGAMDLLLGFQKASSDQRATTRHHVDPAQQQPGLDPQVAAEMDRLLDNFLRWCAALMAELSRRGSYWCDAVDPRTGTALYGTPGARWSEVTAAHALLRYERLDEGACPVILHPTYGTSAYPATVFTNAPENVLRQALDALCNRTKEQTGARSSIASSPGEQQSSAVRDGVDANQPLLRASPSAAPMPLGGGGGGLLQRPLLTVQGVSLAGFARGEDDCFGNRAYRPPALVSNVSFSVLPHQHLLICGANGVGKSTLLRVIAGLHPLSAGTFQWDSETFTTLDPFSPAPRHRVSLDSASQRAFSQHQNPEGIQPNPPSLSSTAMFVPQRGLPAPGRALWQQLAYPSTQRPSTARLCAVVEATGLRHLLQRAGGSFDVEAIHWVASLSPGELQRVAFARVLLHRPKIVLLDEPTAAMSDSAAKASFAALHEAGVTCVTVAQDTKSMRELHRQILRIVGDASEAGLKWRLETVAS